MHALALLAFALVSALGAAGRPLLVAQKTFGSYSGNTPFKVTYHGGRLLTNNISNYIIWYGASWTSTQKAIIKDGINSLGAAGGAQPDLTAFWRIDTEYVDAAGRGPSTNVTVAGQFSAAATGTSPLTDASIQGIIMNSIAAAGWPRDSNAVYHVLMSAEVVAASFCNSTCSYHGSFSAPGGGQDLLYLVGLDATKQCPMLCQPQFQSNLFNYIPPNGDPGADSVVGLIAHELSEIAADPDVSGSLPGGWFDDGTGYENMDYCAYQYGTVFKAGSGSATHYGVNGRAFLVQENYSLVQKACKNYKSQVATTAKRTGRLLQKL